MNIRLINPIVQLATQKPAARINRIKISAITHTLFFVLLILLSGTKVCATVYYSNGNQAPNSVNNWWTKMNGTGSHPANFTSGDVFTIQSGHNMTTSGNWTVSGTGAEILVKGGGSLIAANNVISTKLSINASGITTVNNNKTLRINNGTSATDLFVQGTLANAGTITIASGAVAGFDNGGKYQHTQNGGIIPTATWNSNSTCEIKGITGSVPSGLTGQSFGNFTWDCAQTGNIQLGGNLKSIAGNFTVQNTGSSQLRLTNNTNLTLTIGGDLKINGGILNFASGAASTKVINLGGNYSQKGGTFTNSNSVVLNFNFTGSGKTFSYLGTFTNTYINYTINSVASLTLANDLPVASSRSCTVYGTLNCNTLSVTGAGSFILSAAATLGIGSPYGITASSTSGNILVTGSRTYSNKANYIYSPATGKPVTGDGLPATVNDFTVITSTTDPLKLSNNSLTISGDFSISSGAKLELGTNDQLTVAGNTTLNGGDCLLLSSSSSGTASFVNSGTISGSGNARVERYIANYYTAWDWHFLSSPVTAQPIWNTSTKNFVPVPASGNTWTPGTWNWDFYRWAPQGDPNGYTPYPWVNLRNANGVYNNGSYTSAPYGFGAAIPIFQPGTGYLVAYASDYGLNTPSFSGNLNTGNITIPLLIGSGTNGNNQAYSNNMNLIGNPYPSALDFDAVYSANSTVLSTSSYWIMLGDGSYASYTVGSGGTFGASKYIAPMQGFDVYAESANNLSLTNTMRAHASQAWLKSGETFTNRLVMRVSSDANELSDEIIVHFNSIFGNDGGAVKLSSFATEAPNLYTTKEAGNFSINQLTSTESTSEVPLCLVPGVAANYTLSAKDLESFDGNVPILLSDQITGSTTDLRKNPSYTFAASPGDNPNRFILHFGQVIGITESLKTSLFNIYMNNHTLNIENNSGEQNFEVALFDLQGSLKFQQTAEGKLTQIEIPIAPGMYLIRVLSDKGTNSQKIIIR